MANITLQTIESLPLVEEVNENTSLVGWDGEKTVRVAKDMIGGSELPTAAPYQQLVTDGEGKWGTAERLAYTETTYIEEITWDGTPSDVTIIDGELHWVSPVAPPLNN